MSQSNAMLLFENVTAHNAATAPLPRPALLEQDDMIAPAPNRLRACTYRPGCSNSGYNGIR